MFQTHPDEIGPYRVLEVLGQGGVGTVYLVQQHEPFRRKAALKLVKLGMDTREVLVRFSQERQFLATMNHPNIAKVYDAGQTEQGRPYFVMEYVDGEPITDYCDRNHKSMHERLRLFVDVCRAIQHAHSKGILHRDVKPSNILVTQRDGLDVPMIIDFGLAKVLRTEPASAHLLTREGQFLGTPRYMSPEQIELPSDEVDGRSDVYSLGIVLFELIVGEPPYDRHVTDGGLPRLLDDLRGEEAARPSTRLIRKKKEREVWAAKRRSDPHSLMTQVRGDLDWIVVKALERDRERRYASAEELAADVERYLRREPIHARPPSASYRLERFVRRNPLEVGGIVAVVLALLLGSGLSIYLNLGANRAREEKAAVMQMCLQIGTDVADAHLWFEEIVASDPNQDLERDVLVPLNRSINRIDGAMGLDATVEGLRAARDPAIAAHLQQLHDDITEFREVTMQRARAMEGAGRIGGELDQEYDEIYKRIYEKCNQVVTDLSLSDARDFDRAFTANLVVSIAVVVGFIGASVAALRHLTRGD